MSQSELPPSMMTAPAVTVPILTERERMGKQKLNLRRQVISGVGFVSRRREYRSSGWTTVNNPALNRAHPRFFNVSADLSAEISDQFQAMAFPTAAATPSGSSPTSGSTGRSPPRLLSDNSENVARYNFENKEKLKEIRESHKIARRVRAAARAHVASK